MCSSDLRLRSPNDAAILRDFGNLLRGMGRTAEAEPILRHAAFVAPDDLQVAVYLGATHLSAGRFEEALALFERVRSRAPHLPEPAYFAALCLQSLRRHDEAATVLKALTGAHSPTKEWLKALGHSLFNLGRWSEAIEAHTAALRLDPADDDSAIRVADGYVMLPDYAKALRIVDDVLDRSPRHGAALRLKVQLLQCFERQDEALALCEQLLAADPDDDFAQAQRVSIRQRGCFWDKHDAFVADL